MINGIKCKPSKNERAVIQRACQGVTVCTVYSVVLYLQNNGAAQYTKCQLMIYNVHTETPLGPRGDVTKKKACLNSDAEKGNNRDQQSAAGKRGNSK